MWEWKIAEEVRRLHSCLTALGILYSLLADFERCNHSGEILGRLFEMLPLEPSQGLKELVSARG
jgi:hypothetical protein